MTQQQSTYRHIVKAISLFGGVQVITVLTGIVHLKFGAILLGPAGLGVVSLLLSAVTLISTFSGMGLNYSAVRNISQAYESGDHIRLSSILTVFRRWLWISCFVGSVILIGFSPWLSQFTFGNKKYVWSFVLLSVMLVFSTLTNGNTALLQGTRKLQYTAKSALIGTVSGLMTTIPLYYYFGEKGIVPALIVSAATAFVVSAYFAGHVKANPIEITKQETMTLGKEMVKLGLLMVAGNLLGYLVIYLVNAYVSSKGGLADVGLYQAGTTMTNRSIGLVFTAMAIDYYPRLSSICNDNLKVKEMVNQQAMITVLFAFPILIMLIVFAPIFIHILLSSKFYEIANFIRWLALGSIFTAPMVALGYIALAKGDSRTYFIYGSFLNSLLSLLFYIGGYRAYGLIGMAIAFSLFQSSYLALMCYKFHKLYSFSFTSQFLRVFLTLTLCGTGALLSSLVLNELWGYLVGGTILSVSLYYSWQKLDGYIGLRLYMRKKLFGEANNL